MPFQSRISGTGSYLPSRLLTNQDFEKMLTTSDAWIRERTGMHTRHIADPSEASSDLGYHAAIKALKSAGLTPKDLDAILVATTTPDQIMPSTACLLQARLECNSIMALDISAACSGFIYALSVADQYVKSGMYKNVLVLGAETLSRIVDYTDRGTCILFGDGAGAVILSRAAEGESSYIGSTHLHSDGKLGDLLTLLGGGSRRPASKETIDSKFHYVQMKGREIFKSAVRVMMDRSKEALAANKLTIDDVDWVIVHQANARIIEAVSDLLKIPMEKQLMNIHETGNTSSASIPIVLDEAVRAGKIKRGQTVLLAAFGGGLTSASALLKF